MPATGVAAVVLNMTAVDPAGYDSYMTVYPSGGQRPLASNLNFVELQTQGWFLTNGA